MKIEKVNDNQIRCTLTREDLANRELKISELAYGTEKAKNLFRDMMQQASFECGFEAEDIPLMIEAIPLNSECIVLIITKVEDPEELDTRFSKFAPSLQDDEDDMDDIIDELTEGADEVLDLFKKLRDGHPDVSDSSDKKQSALPPSLTAPAFAEPELTKIYSFDALHEVIQLAHLVAPVYMAPNSLYKDEKRNVYILVLTKGSHTPEEFNRICNVISEYGNPIRSLPASSSFLEEHYESVSKEQALQSLALI